uniref:MLO-like protein 1 n=1 Tax=Aegilops tauschii TaxID=37682 RepID=M8BU84_AEGTA
MPFLFSFSWYLWFFVVIFLLLNVNGWHTYLWIAFIPLTLLLAMCTKLGHVIAQLAQDVAEKHSAVEGDLIVKPSDDHFWFGRTRVVLFLIHFIVFQNAFEIAFFFWILMGSFYKKIFNEHVQPGVLGWAQKAQMKKEFKNSNGAAKSTSTVSLAGPSTKIEMTKRPAREGNDAGESIE